MNKTVSNFLLGFLAGAAAGAIAGILFAPDKGSKTRQNIRKKVKDLSDEFGLGISDLIDEMGLETEPDSRPKRKPKNVKREA
jgi:gas vesicle protein